MNFRSFSTLVTRTSTFSFGIAIILIILSPFTTFAQLDCTGQVVVALNTLYSGTTTSGTSNVSMYDNNAGWEATGPEMVHAIDWPGGVMTLSLSNKTANLDLILLDSCSETRYVSDGGMNSGMADSYLEQYLEAGSYLAVVDGWQLAEGSYDLYVKHGVLDCANAVSMDLGVTYNGSTIGQTDSVSNYNNDPWWDNSGPEDLYELEWPGGEFIVELTNKTASLDLFLLNSCDPNDYISTGGANSGLTNSSISGYFEAGTYYIVVDGWDGAEGTYDIRVEKKVLDCTGAIALTVNTPYSGNTANGNNDVSKYNNDPFWQLSGPEQVHVLNWTGGRLKISSTNQSASLDLLVLDSCDAGSYISSGGANSGPADDIISLYLEEGTYYIVVDGWTEAVGTYDLIVEDETLDCNAIIDLPTNINITGNTTSGNGNISGYGTNPSWISTGPELIYHLDWPGGFTDIELTQKTAELDLIILNECDVNAYFGSGGMNSGTADSEFSGFLNAGSYFVVIDGWDGAEGSFNLIARKKETVKVNGEDHSFCLEDSVLYEIVGSDTNVVETEVLDMFVNFGYVTDEATGDGVSETVFSIKKLGLQKPKRYLDGHFNTDYYKQKFNCGSADLQLYGDRIFESGVLVLEGCDILRCENGHPLAHMFNGDIKRYDEGAWIDINQIITVDSISYFVLKSDNSVWELSESGVATSIGDDAALLQDNDNQLIKIDFAGNYSRWTGGSWEALTPKYVGVSPQMTDQAFWFFIQPKPLLDSEDWTVDHFKGLSVKPDGQLTVQEIPLHGNCEEFLWGARDLGNGKWNLVNKAKGENTPLIITADGTPTFETGLGSPELVLSISDSSKFGTNAYQIVGANETKALGFTDSVLTASPISGEKEQTWLFQFNQMAKDYFLPIPTYENLETHYTGNPDFNLETDAPEILKDYNKFLKADNGVMVIATNTGSDWVVVNYYFVLNNVMNAVVKPKPSDPKVDPSLIQPLSALEGQNLVIVNKNDLNSAIQHHYYTEGFGTQQMAALRGSAGFASPRRWNLISEELTHKVGIVNRPHDDGYRRFDHGIHEFTHTFQGILGWGTIVDSNLVCADEFNKNSECFCYDVQNWFNSSGYSATYPGIRAMGWGTPGSAHITPEERANFMTTFFDPENTWMPPMPFRHNGYNPSGPTIENPIGISEKNIPDLKLFPNPNKGKFTLDIPKGLEPQKLMIYNLLGSVIHEQEITSGIHLFQINKLQPGGYLIAVETKYGNLVKHLIIH